MWTQNGFLRGFQMFRKNYLPRVTIHKCSKTGKYFAEEVGDSFLLYKVCKSHSGEFVLSCGDPPYKFETLDECLEALYWVAYKDHKDSIHRSLTYSKGIKV